MNFYFGNHILTIFALVYVIIIINNIYKALNTGVSKRTM